MALKTHIIDASGTSVGARVTARGVLVVGPLEFSSSTSVTADVINTAYNLVEPQAGKIYIITAILLTSNKNVGAGNATVVLYEADSATSTTSTKDILNIEMVKSTARDLTGISLAVTVGKWVNIKTDDDDIFCTLLGYYADA